MDVPVQQNDEEMNAAALKGGVIALGNFDGVHLGHQAVVRTAVERARGWGVPALVLTFEPHPRSVLKPQIAPFRLTPAPVKEKLLRALGVDEVITLPFTLEFSNLSAEDFVQKILIERLGVSHIVAGFDYVFGHKRGGTMPLLRQWLGPHGVGVTEVTPFRDSGGLIMSSSRTRELLQQGDLNTAAHILGRPWSITGVVEHGAKRGSGIGAPTANIGLDDYLRPKFGVYAVNVRRVRDGPLWQGVANIGTRPTVDGKTEMLEVHLFDFHENLYGEALEVILLDFIRPEQVFDGLPALKAQIAKDIETAKARLAAAL
jgi:riboflavin kinase/FMN adenylyltransferase